MNPIDQRNRTLGELMTELRARLGFVTQGSASKGNEQKFKSFLQEAHDYVYAQLEPPTRRRRATLALVPGESLYDWHNDTADEDIDPGSVLTLWLEHADGGTQQLVQGIGERDREYVGRSWPARYDTLDGQLELSPAPDAAYSLVIEYIAGKPRFEQPADRPGVPDRLVFLYALATAKADYRMPDASASATAFQTMLDKEKMSQREGRRYFVSPSGYVGPENVRRLADGRYALRVT
jgi:hypothetical protein